MNNHLHVIVSATPENLRSPAVKAAIAFSDAADTLKQQIAAEIVPDLSTATTPADLLKVHTTAVTFDRDHAVRQTHADTLAKIAAERLEVAWKFAVIELEHHFAKQFDKAAAELQPALDGLKEYDIDAIILEHYNPQADELRRVFGKLGVLSSIRDAYRFLDGPTLNQILSIPYEASSRVAYFDNAQAEQQFRRTLDNAEFKHRWLILNRTAGATIKWQTKAQQEAQPVGAAVTLRDQQMASGTYGAQMY